MMKLFKKSKTQKNKQLMNQYISPDGWYHLKYPESWTQEFENEVPIFFKPKKGIGTLRISSMKVTGDRPFDVKEYYHERSKIIQGSSLVQLGDHEAFYYIDSTVDSDVSINLHTWEFGKNAILLVSSYTLPTVGVGEPVAKYELDIAKNILSSIVFD